MEFDIDKCIDGWKVQMKDNMEARIGQIISDTFACFDFLESVRSKFKDAINIIDLPNDMLEDRIDWLVDDGERVVSAFCREPSPALLRNFLDNTDMSSIIKRIEKDIEEERVKQTIENNISSDNVCPKTNKSKNNSIER